MLRWSHSAKPRNNAGRCSRDRELAEIYAGVRRHRCLSCDVRMLFGFQYVVLVALAFYVLSAISGQRPLASRA